MVSFGLCLGRAVNHCLIFFYFVITESIFLLLAWAILLLAHCLKLYIYSMFWDRSLSLSQKTWHVALVLSVQVCPCANITSFFFEIRPFSGLTLLSFSAKLFSMINILSCALWDKDCMTISWNVLRGHLRLFAPCVDTPESMNNLWPGDCRATGSVPGVCWSAQQPHWHTFRKVYFIAA